ncbi:acyl-CoA dehydrogenase family protein [Amycolatopsis sp. 3B14]|uniref:acyl-CoA dehydrogenase family protein n=1 Tax=Amycolatopsis sp. 3B14 TaxID=3243600 RepID=UPI003D988B1F
MAADPHVLDAGHARAVAERHAGHADEHRAVGPETVEAVVAAGFARHLVPARWGGGEGGFAELTRAVAEVGRGDTSAAWLASLFAYSARLGAYLPEDGQAELWDKGPDVLVAAALVPGGRARSTPEGWRVSGTWPYTSGIDTADWTLACTRPEDGGPVFVAVPRADFTTADSWHTVGMRGTASHTLILDDVLVPPQRVFRSADAAAGHSAGNPGPVFEVPLRAISGLTFTAPLLGAARGAFDDFRGTLRPGSPAPAGVARADGETDAADLLLHRVAVTADRGGAGPAEVARGLRDSALAASLLVSAVDRLVTAAGTAGQSRDRPLQRFWRDVHTASSHVALRFDKASAAWLRLLEESTDKRSVDEHD